MGKRERERNREIAGQLEVAVTSEIIKETPGMIKKLFAWIKSKVSK